MTGSGWVFKRQIFQIMRKVVANLGVVSVASYTMLLWLPIPFDLALYVLIITAASAIWLAEPGAVPTWPWPDVLMMLMVLALAVSISLSSDVHRSLALSSAVVPAGLLYLMITRYAQSPVQLVVVFFGLTVSALGISSVILSQAFSLVGPIQRVEDAAIPILVVPNDVLFLSLIAPLTLSLLVVAASQLIKAIAVLSLVTTVASVVVLQSRMGLIVLGFSGLIASLGIRRALALKGLLVGLVSILSFDALRGFPLLEKFTSLCSHRAALWAAAWELFLDKPVFGHGPHTFRDLYQDRVPDLIRLECAIPDERIAPWPHNLFLELLSSQGVVGAVVFSAILVWAVSVTYSAAGSDQRLCGAMGWGLLGALGGFVLASIAELSFLRLWVVVLFAILVGSALQLRSCSYGVRQR